MYEAQAVFSPLPHTVAAIQTTVSSARFNRYLLTARSDPVKALELYLWNSFLSHSLYWPIQCLEIAARNSISAILTNRFGRDWHIAEKLRRQLSREDSEKLDEAIGRQQRDRKARVPPVEAVVADLPFGFWTSMLTARYAVPLVWRHNLTIAFPHMPPTSSLHSILRPMEDARVLRNRIAHHEPIFDRRLDLSHNEILRVLGWICPTTAGTWSIRACFRRPGQVARSLISEVPWHAHKLSSSRGHRERARRGRSP